MPNTPTPTQIYLPLSVDEHKPGNDDSNRCPDYDEDCKEVKDHYDCYIGINCKDGTAKGYCPFIHTTN
jgi:hypothetical protein